MRYSEFQPTGFDAKGLGLPERQDWVLAPVVQNRDSGCLAKSNFAVVLEDLGGESDTVEVHRFGHWGPGWYEIILCHPSLNEEIESWEGFFETDCVACSEHYSNLQWETAHEYWGFMTTHDRIELCAEHGVSIFAARRDEIPHDDNGRLFDAIIGEDW